MLVIPAALQTQLDAGVISRIEAMMFDFPAPTGKVGFFSGSGSYVDGGVTFIGAGTLFQVDTVGASSDGTAVGLRVRLNGLAREGLDATVLSQIESIQYRGRPFWLWRRYLYPETYELIPGAQILLYRGYVDKIDYDVTMDGEAFVDASIESRALDLGRTGYRTRSDADQRTIDANDGSLRRVGTIAKKELRWSSFEPVLPVKKRKWWQKLF